MRAKSWVVFLMSFAATVGFPQPSAAQWQTNGNSVCIADRHQWQSRLLRDGLGGVFVVWEDGRPGGGNVDIYCSRLTSDGILPSAWPSTGAPLCTAPGFQSGPVITSDGHDGAIVAWNDARNSTSYDVYSQRVCANGRIALGWPVDGVAVCTGSCGQSVLVADEMGGTMDVWGDARNGDSYGDIYAQHVSGSGGLVPGWPVNGFGVNTSPRTDNQPAAMPDGTGGVFVAWESFVGSDLFAQRVTGSGAIAPGWPLDGLIVSAAASNQRDIVLTSDGAGGVLAAWYDARSDNGDIYAQRFTSTGMIAPGWPADGLAVCTASNDQLYPAIVSVADGAIIAWADFRSGTTYDIYAQRITGAGGIAPGWPTNGVPVCTAPGMQTSVVVVPDRVGGTIAAWVDRRDGAGDIYAQRITGAGEIAPGWPPDGLALCAAQGEQSGPAIEVDDEGGAFVSWTDDRDGSYLTSSDVYAARVTSAGVTGPAIPMQPLPKRLQFVVARPNPTRGQTTLSSPFHHQRSSLPGCLTWPAA